MLSQQQILVDFGATKVCCCKVDSLFNRRYGSVQSAVHLQDWSTASEPGHTSGGHCPPLRNGMGASRLRLPQRGPCGSAPFTHSICQLRASPHEKLDDGQCAFVPPRQI